MEAPLFFLLISWLKYQTRLDKAEQRSLKCCRVLGAIILGWDGKPAEIFRDVQLFSLVSLTTLTAKPPWDQVLRLLLTAAGA